MDPTQVNGTGEEVGEIKRDVKSHMLFEISTEVANRGKLLLLSFRCTHNAKRLP